MGQIIVSKMSNFNNKSILSIQNVKLSLDEVRSSLF